MTVNEFMANFMVATADFYRLDDAVREYVNESVGWDKDSKIYSIRKISDCIESCKESIPKAMKSGKEALRIDIPNKQVYEDVISCYGMAAHWNERVSLLIEIMRTIFIETDADSIELLARSREDAGFGYERPERTLDIADGIELFSEYPDEDDEESAEDSDEIEDYSDDDESEDDVLGWVTNGAPSDTPENRLREVENPDDGELEVFVQNTPQSNIADVPEPIYDEMPEPIAVEKPLTREEIQSIVLETMKDFFSQTAAVVPQEEDKPKRGRRKSASTKTTRRGIRRKKADEEAIDEMEVLE